MIPENTPAYDDEEGIFAIVKELGLPSDLVS